MTEKNFFTCDNPIMFDWENGKCRCTPILYKEDKMTEKRFSFDDEIIWENISPNSRIEIFPQKAVELLNKLHEENVRLKKERNHFEKKKTQYLTEWNTCRIQNTELKKDNQELKEAMKRMMIEMMGGKMND